MDTSLRSMEDVDEKRHDEVSTNAARQAFVALICVPAVEHGGGKTYKHVIQVFVLCIRKSKIKL